MISSVRGSQQVRSNRVMPKPGGFDSVCELGQMDHRPQGFETKQVRRWRWGKKGALARQDFAWVFGGERDGFVTERKRSGTEGRVRVPGDLGSLEEGAEGGSRPT